MPAQKDKMPLQTVGEMTGTLQDVQKSARHDRSITPTQAANAESVRLNVQRLYNTIRREREAVDLDNTGIVRQRALEYLQSCAEVPTTPTVSGLYALGLGLSRQAVAQWCIRHPNHQTAQFIEVLKESFADLLAASALGGSVAPVPAIFVLKNCYGWIDRMQVTPAVPVRAEDEYSAEDIAKRYMTD